jgi:hypothetical protein
MSGGAAAGDRAWAGFARRGRVASMGDFSCSAHVSVSPGEWVRRVSVGTVDYDGITAYFLRPWALTNKDVEKRA